MTQVEIIIAGSTLTPKVESFKVERNLNDKSYAEVNLVNEPPIDVSLGDTLVIKAQSHSDSLRKIFSGKITSSSKGSQEGQPVLKLKGEDLLSCFDSKNIYEYYESETGKNILLDILSVCPEITTNHVEDCTTSLNFTAKGKTRLETIQDLCSRLAYDFFLDPDNDFHFFEKDSKVSGMTITLEDLENYSYKKDASQIVNKILILGAKYTIPSDIDGWTESTSNWSGSPNDPALIGHVAPFMPRAGKNAITVQGSNSSTQIIIARTFSSIDFTQVWSPSFLNFDIGMKAESGISSIYLRLKTDNSNYFQKDLTAKYPTSSGGWIHISEEIPTGWTSVGSPSWSSITSLEIVVNFDSASTENQVFIDRLYFSGARYHGFAEDTSSQDTWGLHEPPHIVKENIYSDSECQKLAETIISENKDPKEVIEETALFPGWEDLPLGEKVEFQVPEGTFSRRVVKLTHEYDTGAFITRPTLAETARSLEDILNSYDQELKQRQAEKEEKVKELPPPASPSLPSDVTDLPDVEVSAPSFSLEVKEVDTSSEFRTWLNVKIDKVDEASGYVVGYRELGETEWHHIYVEQPEGTSNTIRTPDLKENTTYEVHAAALSPKGQFSSWATTQTATTATNDVPPSSPSNLQTTAVVNGVLLEWDPVSANDFSHYEIYKGTTSPPTDKVGETSRPSFFWKMGSGDSYEGYYFGVKAVDIAGNASDITVTTSKITPLKIQNIDIGVDAVHAEQIMDGEVGTAELQNYAVSAAKLKKGLQTYWSNINFYPTSGSEHDSLSYTTGSIKLADGSTISVSAGTISALPSGVSYIYFDIADEPNYTLHATSSIDLITDERGILALVRVSDDTSQELEILPLTGSGMKVIADTIGAGAIYAEKLHLQSIFLHGIIFSASGNGVQWTSGYISYGGNKYEISSGSATETYIYWKEGDSSLTSSSSKPEPVNSTDGKRQWILVWNDTSSSDFIELWNATHIHGGQIITDSITATEIASKTIETENLKVGIITPDRLSPTVKEADNVLLNPSFEVDSDEDGVPDHWEVSTGVTRESTNSYDGTYHMRIPKPDTGHNYIVSDLYSQGEVKEGANVVLKFYCRNDISNGTVRACIHCYDSSDQYITTKWEDFATTTDWREYVYAPGALPTNTTKIKVAFENQSSFPSGNMIRIDAVRLLPAIKGESIINIVADKVIFSTTGNKLTNLTTEESGVTVIEGGKIKSRSIDASKIVTNSLTSNEIAAGAITARELSVGVQNEVPDGDFELGNASLEWTGGTAQTSVVYEGSYALQLSGNSEAVSKRFIPVKGGKVYHLEGAIRSSNSSYAGIIYIYWYDLNENYLSYDSLISSSTSWTLKEGEFTAPSKAYFAKIRLWSPTVTHYFDAIKLWQKSGSVDIQDGCITTSHIRFNALSSDPASKEIGMMWYNYNDNLLKFVGRDSGGSQQLTYIPRYPLTDISAPPENILPNDSFEIDRDGDDVPDYWSKVQYGGGVVERISTDSYKGGYCVRCYAPAPSGSDTSAELWSNYIPVKPSRDYYLGAAIKVWTGINTAYMLVRWYDSDKSEISTDILSFSVLTSWKFYGDKVTSPSNARYAKIEVYVHNPSADTEHRFDAVVFSELRSARATSRVVGAQASYAIECTTIFSSWTDLGGTPFTPNEETEMYFIQVHFTSDTNVFQTLWVRVYDETTDTYFPNSDGWAIGFYAGKSHSPIFTIPYNVKDHSIKIQAKTQDGRSFCYSWQAWGISPHYHR